MNPRTLDKQVLLIAQRQHGVFSHAQLLQLGATPSQVRHRLRQEEWVRVLPRVWRMAWAIENDRTRAMAATLWAGLGAVVSRTSAAALWGLLEPTQTIHVTTRQHLRSPASWIVLHQSLLERSMLRVRLVVPVTSPSRTLFDLASDRSLDFQSLVEDAVRRRLTTRLELVSLMRALRTQRRSGAVRFQKLLVDEPAEAFVSRSALEQLALRTFAHAGIPQPCVQYPITVLGVGTAVADFAWPEQRVVVETDGYRFHSGRDAWESDLARHNALVSAGWRPIRMTWRALRDQKPRLLALLRGLLHRAAHGGPWDDLGARTVR
ncbi:MAG: DUF559 domain-containing protein [Myxococcaceae bacterium]